MSMHVKLGLIMMALISYFGPLGFAQDSLRFYELDPVTVSGSRVEDRLQDVPRNVSVISRQQIEAGNYLHMADLLQREAGVMIIGAQQTPGSQQSLFLRGANSNQTAILINGIRITDPSTPNGALDLNELSLLDIERIEIVRGGQSTLYGTSGVGGTINIITRQGARKQGSSGSAFLNVGTFGAETSMVQMQASLHHQTDNQWYVSGFVHSMWVNGLDASLDTLSDAGIFRTNDRDDFRKIDFGGRVGKTFDRGNFNVNYRAVRQSADFDAGAYRDHDQAQLEFHRNFLQADGDYSLNKNHSLHAIVGYTASQRLNTQNLATVDAAGNTDQTLFRGQYEGALFTAELQSNVLLSQKIRLISGIGLYNEAMRFDTYFFSDGIFGPFESVVNYDTVNTRIQQGYAFAQLRYAAQEDQGFGFTLGGRATRHSLAGIIASFEANPYWKFSEGNMLFFTLSSGFLAPSLFQLYDPTSGFNAFTTRGNMDLKPEQSLSTEVAYRLQRGGLHYQLGVFRNQVRDAISYVYLWNRQASPSALGFADYRGDTYLNLAEQLTYGAEASVQGNLTSRLTFHANVSYVEGSFRFDSNDIPEEINAGHFVQLFDFGSFITEELVSDQLVRRPNFMANLSMNYLLGKGWTTGFFARYVGARPDIFYQANLGPFGALATQEVGAFSTLDLQVAKQINSSWTMQGRIENLSNNSFSEINGFATRGRGFYLMARYQFK